MFKVDLVDCLDGKTMIEGTFYTEETAFFYNQIVEGRSYIISNPEVSQANKRFTTIKHDYRLIFKLESEFKEVDYSEKSEEPSKVALNLVSISDVLGGNSEFTVEVYGMVNSECRRDQTVANHCPYKENYKGRLQLTICETVGRSATSYGFMVQI